MPAIFHNTPGAALFFVLIVLEAVFGCLLVLFPLLPFMVLHPVLYRKMIDHLMMIALGLPLSLMEFMFDVRVVVSGDVPLRGEKALVIMNHRTMVDWLFFFQVLMHYSSVKTEKIILKRAPSMLPGHGWSMQMANYIFLDRKWEKDKPMLETCFNYFRDLKYSGTYLLFPEGTDFCEASEGRSNSFADKNGLPHYKYVLHPRTTGFAFILDYMRETNLIDSVIDVTVGYPDRIPVKFDPFMGKFPQRVQFHLQRYKLSELPSETTQIEKWCTDRWVEKESHLEEFYTKKRRLVDIMEGSTTAAVCESNGTVSHQNGDLEQNGNSIKNGELGNDDTATAPRGCDSRESIAFTHPGDLVTILIWWIVFTVFTLCGLYFSAVLRYQCLVAFAVFFLAYYLGGTNTYQILSYNWLRGSRLSPPMTV